jgi:hypothetical protein
MVIKAVFFAKILSTEARQALVPIPFPVMAIAATAVSICDATTISLTSSVDQGLPR